MTAMSAADVREALFLRWPPHQYLHINEAPLDISRQGTKIDVLVVGLWPSVGLQLDAIEVKVDYSDWRKEIERRELFVVKPHGRRYRIVSRDHARWDVQCGATIEQEVIPDTSKSLLWRLHAHRFWIACPLALATRIRDEVPEGWGVLACGEGGTRVVVKPVVNDAPNAIDWPKTVGLLRSAADCGFNALQRAERRGYEAGRQAAVEAKGHRA